MTTDEWVTTALTDDAVVVELLFRLKQSSSEPFLSPPLRWGLRLPRSKPAAAASAAATATSKKELESMRCSPTTPLSWSCGGGGAVSASPSDGSDDSSGSRSKGNFTNETIAATTINKRSRKKKSFAELREEESSLLKEKIHLKKELATIRVTLKEQKARSENLKRLKLDLHLQSAIKMAANSHQPNFSDASIFNRFPVSPTVTTHQDLPAPTSCKVEKEVETMERCFIVPDLNMIPSEEDSGCEKLYGLS